jgi:hypothetical protein
MKAAMLQQVPALQTIERLQQASTSKRVKRFSVVRPRAGRSEGNGEQLSQSCLGQKRLTVVAKKWWIERMVGSDGVVQAARILNCSETGAI